MTDADHTQQLMSRVGGLAYALELTLRAHAVTCGDAARRAIESLRDEAIDAFRNSDISPEREMDHAMIAGPAIEAVKQVFDSVIADLDE